MCVSVCQCAHVCLNKVKVVPDGRKKEMEAGEGHPTNIHYLLRGRRQGNGMWGEEEQKRLHIVLLF